MATKKTKSMADVLSELHALLEPFESEERMRLVSSVLILLGDRPVTPSQGGGGGDAGGAPHDDGHPDIDGLHANAIRWLKKYEISAEHLEKVFYIDGSDVDIVADKMPGTSKKEQTMQAYLLCGVKSLLTTGSADIVDSEAIAFSKHVGAYDKNNHTANRKSLGNRATGTKESGLKLAAEGLREGAELVKSIAGNGS